MKFAKIAAPTLAAFGFVLGASAIADAPEQTGDDGTVTLCIVGSDDALNTPCVISCDGDPLAGIWLVPGDNLIPVPEPLVDALVVTGEEVIGVSTESSHPDNPGIN